MLFERSTLPAASSTTRSASYVNSLAASIPRCSPIAALMPPSMGWPAALRCRSSSSRRRPSACPIALSQRPTSSLPRRSPTSPSTPGDACESQREPPQPAGRGRGLRRRRRRRRPGDGFGTARPARPCLGGRRPLRGRLAAGAGHDGSGDDPMRVGVAEDPVPHEHRTARRCRNPGLLRCQGLDDHRQRGSIPRRRLFALAEHS